VRYSLSNLGGTPPAMAVINNNNYILEVSSCPIWNKTIFWTDCCQIRHEGGCRSKETFEQPMTYSPQINSSKFSSMKPRFFWICMKKKMKICGDQDGHTENLSIFYEVPRKRQPRRPMSKCFARNGTKFRHVMEVAKSI
jgi:hypothetical protein